MFKIKPQSTGLKICERNSYIYVCVYVYVYIGSRYQINRVVHVLGSQYISLKRRLSYDIK